MSMTTGERIKERRTELGLSADSLATKIGISRSTMFRYESGAIEKIPLENLVSIANSLNTTVKYLMGWDACKHADCIQHPPVSGNESAPKDSQGDLGRRIHDLRTSQKLTLEQVANEVGVGKSTVRKWETGMIADMRCDKIAALAKALQTTPEYLMGWSTGQSGKQKKTAYVVLSPKAQKFAAAFDKATAKEQQIIQLMLSEYLDDEKASWDFTEFLPIP